MANRIYDAFDSIKAQPQLVQSTKQFLSEKQKKDTRHVYHFALQRSLIAVCCFVLVLTAGIRGYSWFQMPVSYVSIDVNPSIELALNRFNRVVSIDAYNTQGAEILKELSLKGKKYTEALHLIVESKAMEAYLTDESELVFTVAAIGSREKELKSGVKSCAAHMDHKCQSVSADIEIVSKAHGHGVSLGKYYAYLQLARYDSTVTVDDCKNMSMADMHSLITEHQHMQNGEHSNSEEYEYLNESSTEDSAAESHHSGHHHRERHE